jgi:hypothetical protein
MRRDGKMERTFEKGATRSVVAVATAVLAVFAMSTTVFASNHGFEITIPIDTIRYGEVGQEILLASVDLDEGDFGQSCLVVAESRNQESEHPDNDLEVRSGSTLVTLPNVENDADGIVDGLGVLVLGNTIEVWLIMGPDRIFSAGIDVNVDCSPVDTTVPPETTLPPETTGPPVDTTVPPVDTTIPAPTTTFPDEVSPTEVVPTTEAPEVSPTTLPFTGAATENLALIALVLTGAGILALVATRRPKED